MIASYTFVDGIGIRHSLNPYTYLFWMLLLNGTPALVASFMFKNDGLRNINKDLVIKGMGIWYSRSSCIWFGSLVYAIPTHCLCISFQRN